MAAVTLLSQFCVAQGGSAKELRYIDGVLAKHTFLSVAQKHEISRRFLSLAQLGTCTVEIAKNRNGMAHVSWSLVSQTCLSTPSILLTQGGKLCSSGSDECQPKLQKRRRKKSLTGVHR